MADDSVDPYELSRDLVEQNKAAKRRRERKANGDDRQRRRLANLYNIVQFVAEQPNWRDAVQCNQLTEDIEVCEPYPPRDAEPRAMRPLKEPDDVVGAMLWLQANGWRAAKSVTLDMLYYLASKNAHHPVRDYLTSLRWDGVARVGKLFLHYFNAAVPDDEQEVRDRHVAYLEHAATCFMVSAVARIIQPGCKVDYLPVLIGDQGLGKSEGLRALCTDPAWFSDDLSTNLIDRDTKESLRGKWIIELAEIPHVRRDVEKVKAFFSRRTDRYRRAYAMLTQDHQRQCVFIGTSNDLELVDASGNRRFWPVEVAGPIETATITADRDQLWAEALALYRQGTPWWLAPRIETIAVEMQEAFGEHDIWQDKIDAWLPRLGPFTLDQVFVGPLGYSDTSMIPKSDQNRAAVCLKRLGYRRRRCRRDGLRAWWWDKKTQALRS